MISILDKIRSRGYWRVVIRPLQFIPNRVEYSNLLPILEKSSVQYRSLGFPHVDPYNPLTHRQIDWIGHEYEFMNFIESWRFYQSGQFAQRSAMWLDWRDLAGWGAMPENWKPGVAIGIGETVLRFTEIIEFASRLALTEAGDKHMHIEVTVCNIHGRVLYNDIPAAAIPGSYQSSIIEFPYVKNCPKEELLSRSRELALEASRDLFLRFNWNPSIDFLRSIQPRGTR